MCLHIMVVRDVQSYIAQVVVISEMISVVQSIINVHGGSFSYFNLVVFFFLCLPVLLQSKISLNVTLLLLLYLALIFLKLLFQDLGEYYVKAMILLLTLPIYFILIQRTTFDHIACVCVQYIKIILCLGAVYIISWYFLGAYRNASTITIFLMLVLGYKHIWQGFASLVFAAVMKTQYKIWAILSLGGIMFRNKYLRFSILFLVGLAAITFPLLLLDLDIGWANFTYSQTSSLDERLNEVKSFLEVMSGHVSFFVFGWPIGSAIVTEGLSERGYMHSAYLWLVGTLGVPIFTILFFYIIARRTVTTRCFYIRLFLITFLLLTNPFCTALLFANEKKLSN
jgi:hypothetical protein